MSEVPLWCRCRRRVCGASACKTCSGQSRPASPQFENNYFTEMCSGSEAGSYFRLIDFVYHSTPGLRVIKKKRHARGHPGEPPPHRQEREFFIHNLMVRIHFIIVIIGWTGLAPWEFEFPFPCSFTSKFLGKTCSGPSRRASPSTPRERVMY